MPSRRRYSKPRRNYKKRYPGQHKIKRYPNRIAKSTIPRSLFPNRKIVSLNYADTFTLNVGVSGNLSSYRIACNGLYDPDITATGHQPLGFDQLSPFYAKMTVIGSHITAIFTPSLATTNQGYVCGIHRNPNLTSAPSSFQTYLENGNARMQTFMFGNTGGKAPQITHTFSTKKHMSVTNPLDEPNLASTASSNPTTLAGYDVFYQPADQSTDTESVVVNIRVQYIAICSDPIPVASS